MMRNFISLFFTLISLSFFAQKYTLQWNGTEVMDYGSEKLTFPKFSNSGYEAGNNNVYINIRNLSNGNRYQITNLIWEKVNAKDLYSIELLSLPTS